nr:uncharacterized protein CI109_006075 [Kwoniella shandongensis]KAA5525624.1 hypothetical protein CI109_006075 [Kwoniella shandongensis]
MALPLPALSKNGARSLDSLLKKEVDSRDVPALFFGATNAKEEIYFSCDGDVKFGDEAKGTVDAETTLMMFSMTKFITTIACLQLVDEGKIDLEDYDLVAKHCPEIGELQILEGYTDDGKEILTKPKNKINLLMLLSHTSGMSYTWNSANIARWGEEHNRPPWGKIESYSQPLFAEPGTRWQYSVGIDWAGILISRVTGKSLEDLFKEKIFEPCGMKSTSFYPTDDIKSRLMTCCERDKDGKVRALDAPPMGRILDASKVGPVLSGGGGLYGTARDYLNLLRNVLASVDPETKNPLISPKSFKLLFTDVLPSNPKIKADLAGMAKDQNVHDSALLTNGSGGHIGHSPGLFLTLKDSANGRKAGSGNWDGAAKTYFWLDPATGVGAVCCTNIMANNPDPHNKTFNRFERTLYDALEL